MSALSSLTKITALAGALITLLLGCFALDPNAHAVTPPPDGGYPGGNTAEGIQALQSLTSGAYNTALGQQALFRDTTGSYNTAEGFRALFYNSTGVFNTATGVNALYSNTTGRNNEANGFSALFHNTTGTSNAANGFGALFSNTIGGNNVASGTNALYSNTIGVFNVANGSNALFHNTTGNNNTGNGTLALYNNTSGSGNIALGRSAGFNLTVGNNNIDIANVGIAGESGIIRIGTLGTHTDTFLTGRVTIPDPASSVISLQVEGQQQLSFGGIPTLSVGTYTSAHLEMDNNEIQAGFAAPASSNPSTLYLNYSGGNIRIGASGSTTTVIGTFVNSSDRNAKEDFAPVNAQAVLDQLQTLPLSTWKYKGGDARRHVGPVAQDFHAAFDRLLDLKSDDKTIAPLDEAGVAFAAIQALQTQVTARDEKIAEQEKQIRVLVGAVSTLEARDQGREARLARLELNKAAPQVVASNH